VARGHSARNVHGACDQGQRLYDGSLDTTLTYPLDDQTWQATWGWSGERNAEGQAIGFTRTQVVAIRYVCEKGKEPHRVLRFVSTQDEPDDENDDVMGEV
jgi:hypothetical protein